jgi:NDP-hexose-3-ketoreductase
MTKPIKIGVMGCANIATRSIIPKIKANPLFELVSIASRSLDKAQKYADLFNCKALGSYEELVNSNDIDAIYMPLPTGLHEEWVLKSLDKNKHILIEKSLAINYQSAKKMVEKAKEKNLLIMEDFMFLYHSQQNHIKQVLNNGEIGEIRCFRSSFGFPPFTDDNFRYNKELGGGALLDAAAYTVRASQLFFGNDLNVQAAQLNTINNKEVDIYGGAFLTDSKGTVMQLAFGFDNYYQCNYEFWGSKGKLIVHKSFTPKENEKPVITIHKQDESHEYSLPSDDHFKNILTEFATSITSGNFEVKYTEILNQSRLLNELKIKSTH